MADYTDNALLASIKALDNVVLPAVNPGDPLASEQLRLVSGLLKFMRQRLAYWPQRYHFELDHYLALGQQLHPDAKDLSGEAASRLGDAIDRATTLRQRGDFDLQALQGATAELSQAISALARAAVVAPHGQRRRVERSILEASKRWVDMQRAWFLPQGFELRAGELPELQEVLRRPV